MWRVRWENPLIIMRNICLLLFLTASMATASCGKEEFDGAVDYISLLAKYELRTRTGGLAAETKTYPAGNGNAYLFETGNTYKRYADGQLSQSGSYKITQDSSILLHQTASRIIFDNDVNAIRTMIKFSTGKMTLQEDVYDGRTYEYQKVE